MTQVNIDFSKDLFKWFYYDYKELFGMLDIPMTYTHLYYNLEELSLETILP